MDETNEKLPTALRPAEFDQAVMVIRTGKGYFLTLVGTPPYEGESRVSTSKGMIFDCEFGGKKGRIVVKCEPENPAKVTKEELDKAIEGRGSRSP